MTTEVGETLRALQAELGADWNVWYNATGRTTTPDGWPLLGPAGTYVFRHIPSSLQRGPVLAPIVFEAPPAVDPFEVAKDALDAVAELQHVMAGEGITKTDYGTIEKSDRRHWAEQQNQWRDAYDQARAAVGVPQDASGRFAEPIATITLDDTTPDVLGVTQDPPHVELHVRDLRNGKNELRRYRIALEPL